MDIMRAGSRPSLKAPAKYFTGTVRQDPIYEVTGPGRMRSVVVTFEPGARTNWHTHPFGQTLLIQSGLGRVQTWGQPVQEVRRFWAQVQKQCGLQDVRIHDLRHTFASLLVSGGASLEMIGKLLGHSQMQTTLRYAHLMDSPLRAGVDAVASAFRPKPRLVHDADDQGGRKTA